jgi:hypothetical protein
MTAANSNTPNTAAQEERMTAPKNFSRWVDHGTEPCDPAIFREALDVWHTGAQVPLRERRPAGPGYVLTDIPVNRAAMATVAFLKARGVAHQQAYLMRLLNFGDVLQAAKPGGPLARFVKPSDTPDDLLVSEALLDAVAMSSVLAPAAGSLAVFDLVDIERRAAELMAADGEAHGD